MTHGAHAALCLTGIGDSGERRGDHVAVLERSCEFCALLGIMAQPVEELGEAPLVRVDASAPLDGFEIFRVGERCDLLRFFFCAVIAPEVVVVERFEVGVDGNYARSGSVKSDSFNLRAVDFGLGDGFARGLGESVHLVRVGLGCVVGVFAFAFERILGRGGAEASTLAVEQRDAHAEGSEIYACDDGHCLCSVSR